MRVSINGEVQVLDDKVAHVDAMLLALGHDLSRVAVEKNGSLVPRATRNEVAVTDGDAFEVVSLVGGCTSAFQPRHRQNVFHAADCTVS